MKFYIWKSGFSRDWKRLPMIMLKVCDMTTFDMRADYVCEVFQLVGSFAEELLPMLG